MQACQSLPVPGHHPVSIKLRFKVSPFPPSHFIAECTEEIAGCIFDKTSEYFQVKLVLSWRIMFKLSYQSINQFGTSCQAILNEIEFILRGKLLFV